MNTDLSSPSDDPANEARWNLLQRGIQEARVTRAFKLFRANGIEPILIKGLAVGRFYPADKSRASIDIDFTVSNADFEKAMRLASSAAAEGLAIDLHRELRHLDTVPWQDLSANSRELPLANGAIRVLRPEDHLRVLCVHWLTDGGVNKSRLWDIYYLVSNRNEDFDWRRLLETVDPIRRRWITCTLGLARRYFGLPLDETPVDLETKDLPGWLIRTVEAEWASKDKDKPLEFAMYDGQLFFEQLVRRLRPNPIRATVEMGGSFDARTRIFYQIGNSLRRIRPTLGRIATTIRNRLK